MRPLVVACFAAGILVRPTVYAQIDTATVYADQAVRHLFDPVDDETTGLEVLADDLAELLAAPIDVNTASAADLLRLPNVSPVLAAHIVRHRTRHGLFARVEDLRTVEGLTDDDYRALSAFVSIGGADPRTGTGGPGRKPRQGGAGGRFEALQRITRPRAAGTSGVDTTQAAAPGSPYRFLTRFRRRGGRMPDLSLVLDHDPGEPFVWAPGARALGFDFASAHLAWRDRGPLQLLVAGDYTVAAGQGLVFGRNTVAAHGPDVLRAALRATTGPAPYASTDEDAFFRGVAAAFALPRGLTAAVFVSRRHRDGAPSTADSSVIRSLVTGGLHRSPLERARRGIVRQDLAGALVVLDGRHLRLGAVAYATRFHRPLVPDATPDRRYALRGRRSAAASVYLDAIRAPWYLFGETALGPGAVAAWTGGIAYERDRLQAIVHLRHYPAGYASLHGHGFGTHGTAGNESGIYTGMRLRLPLHWTVAASFDQHRSPWLRFRTPRPETGHDLRLFVEYRPRPWLALFGTARSEMHEQSASVRDPGGRVLQGLQARLRRSLRLHGMFDFSQHLTLQARIEAVRSVEASRIQRGVAMYQDVRWRPTRSVEFDGRLTFFDTDGFDARIYAYEDDVRHAMSVPPLQGRGQRMHLFARLRPRTGFTLEFKYATTWRSPDASAAPRSIPGLLRDHELALQAFISFRTRR